MDENEISNKVIGAAIEVHKYVGPGLLEAIYKECLGYELKSLGLRVQREVALPIKYKGLKFKKGYRADLIIENMVIVELKAVENVTPVYTAQLLSYLRMSSLRLGILLNFNVAYLRDGVKRVVNNL
ncbi:MAG: GxxExxY protein [Gammaproteobacteria bacterium]|nr:GxxExxY protein [Gammaproteobacteria bacterium]